MDEELDILQDTTQEGALFADSTMQAEQSASECPEGFSYNEELGACVADDFKLDLGNNQTPFGIDLRPLFENRPDPVVQGEDGEMYRNNTYLTASGWVEEPDYSTPVYFFHQPLELGDPREIYYTLSEEGSLESQFGTWRTEEEIKGYWDADQGMGYFKEANPNLDYDTWFSFVKDASALSASGLNRNDNPEEFDALVNQYGIATSFQNPDGDIFEWNGSSFTKTYKVDDSFPIGDIIMSVAIGYMTAGILGPGGAFGSSGLFGGGAAGGAASGAIGSTIAQGVINGKIDPTSVVTAGVLGGINGFFNELTTGELGITQDAAGNAVYTINGEVMSTAQNLADTYITKVANVLGLPYNEAAGIVQGVLQGTVSGEDLEGIAINAVGGWSEAKIKGFLTNTFGEGVDVDNWFREGDSFIPTEALFPFVESGIQAAIDGGISETDLLKMLGGYFQAGGDLDFILPQLPDLGLDFDVDFCKEFPGFPLCGDGVDLPDIKCPEWMKDDEGNCLDIDCPEWLKNEDGECLEPNFDVELCSDEELEQGGETIRIGTPNSWYCKTPETAGINVELCSDEELEQGGHTVRIGTPDSWYCKVPKVDVGCDSTPVPNGKQLYKKNSIGECVPDVIECIEGFDLVGQECVKVSGGLPDLCSEPRPEQYGIAQINWDKYCKVPEISCPDGQEYNTELGECVDIKVPETTCPEGFRNEDGECVKIEGPDVDIDVPDVDLPSISLPSATPSKGMFEKTAPRALSYTTTPVPEFISTPQKDWSSDLEQLIARQLKQRGMFT